MTSLTHQNEQAPQPEEKVLTFPGRVLLPNRSEHMCKAAIATPYKVDIFCEEIPAEGDHIVAYLEEIGRIEGAVCSSKSDQFCLEIEAAKTKRDKLASKLQWLRNRHTTGQKDQRRHLRYEPLQRHCVLTLPDGSTCECEILDISLMGASLKVDRKPPIGDQGIVGQTTGQVARIHESGIAIDFIAPLSDDQIKSFLKHS